MKKARMTLSMLINTLEEDTLININNAYVADEYDRGIFRGDVSEFCERSECFEEYLTNEVYSISIDNSGADTELQIDILTELQLRHSM